LQGLDPEAAVADAAYDSEQNLKFILHELNAKPVIARRFGWVKYQNHTMSGKGTPICLAGLEMTYWGRFLDRGRVRLKYVCPITHLKSYREKYSFCPWNHPKFTKGKGCYVYVRADDTARKSIDYGSAEFKRLYNLKNSLRTYHLKTGQFGYPIPIC